jgi:tetratricopeptide (TPR) repeat protein
VASRLLAQLASRIAAARDPVVAACLRAQRGIYLARQGKYEHAQATVDAIRSEFGARPDAQVTAWVSLVEALIHFYSQPGPRARDRLQRAQVLSRAMNHPVLVPLCAAWLAHVEFNDNRMQPMLQQVREALQRAQPDHHAALARVSLVVADALHFAGRFDLAKPWYAKVREHALAEGDDAMISAMLHNVAAFRASKTRLAASFGEADMEEVSRAMMEAESTGNYDAGIGTASLAWFVPLLRAQLLTVEGRYEEAIALFASNLASAEAQGVARLMVSFLADSAWCHFQVGNAESASAHAALCLEAATPDCDPDDLAASLARVAAIYEAHGSNEKARDLRERARASLAQHVEVQKRLLNALLELLPNGKWGGEGSSTVAP